MNDWYKPNIKNNRKWLIITAAVLVAVLVVAGSVFAFIMSGFLRITIIKPQDQKQDEMLPSDFKDYLNSFYTTVRTDDSNISIPQYTEAIDYEINLNVGSSPEITLQELYKKCSPWIVSISASEDGENYKYWGSGIIISQDGLILTNTHIIDGCSAAFVQLYDMSKYDAYLIAADTVSDIALLKIESTQALEYAQFADSSNVEVGMEVAAIGSPLGDAFRNTLTNGIISAIERGIMYNGHTMTLLQTNTALNEGNSGGALFNMAGEVIGITNMKMMSHYSSIEGIAFAIPSLTIEKIAADLVEKGYVERTTIGIVVGSIPQNVLNHYNLPEGIYVSSVREYSGAAEAGIVDGDIIVKVEGNPVKSLNDINEVKDKLSIGDEIHFSIFRDNETFDVTVVLQAEK